MLFLTVRKTHPSAVPKSARFWHPRAQVRVTDEERRLSPEHLPVVVGHLEETIREVEAWGVRIAAASRFHAIARLLKQTAERGGYPCDREELAVLGEAIRDAQEIIEIANVLPAAPIPSVVNDLQVAVGGALSTPGPTGPHLRLQTQLWVGAMLTTKEHAASVLAHHSDEKNPDYILWSGTLMYALEVKRPNGTLDAHNVVRKAARQIRDSRFHGGVIVVDLTDCIEPDLRLRFGSGAPESNPIHARVHELMGETRRQ